MSYILDALKKSEREKTLGQVPTLETVVSDGAKMQLKGTPWWLNLLVFLGFLLAILAIMYFFGLISLDSKKESFSQTGNSAQNAQVQTQANQAAAVVEQEIQSPTAVQQDAVVEPVQLEVVEPVIVTEPEVQQVITDTATEDRAAEIEEIAAVEQPALTPLEAEELAALEQLQQAEATGEVPALQAEPEVQQSVETESVAAQQPQKNNYEEVLHENLRNVAVNVVSYSSDARQRFVMFDLTIYKEGDSLPNGADIIEIQRTGAIVEFQNKRYLLKP